MDRREWLRLTLGGAGGLTLGAASLRALAAPPRRLQPITRAIPSSGERLPIIGLGSSATFAQAARHEDVTALREVLGRMVELGGRVFDTAPAYGASEEVAGGIARELGLAQQLFWATKLNVAQRGASADPAAARRQLETSFLRIGKPVIDLVQVHNMGDVRTQLPILREYKEAGRVRYIGVTTTFESQYEALVETMRTQPLDFIGTDYAVDNRHAEETILPLARDRGIAVLVYAPFGRTRLWARVAGRKLPEWAAELDAASWAQFFLKYVASHPAVTAITPATSRPANVADNMGGGTGRLPDLALRKRMIELIESLPPA
jgi:aryl-alcohol dehydrogenase-like predicted oxidoreductase